MEDIKEIEKLKLKKNPDLYERWVLSGQLTSKLDQLTTWKRALVTQREMAKALGISEDHFLRLKRRHPKIQEAFDKGMVQLKTDLVGAMYKKAMGYEVKETDMIIDDNGKSNPKKKIRTQTRQVPGDYNAQVYLLNKYFGEEYNPNYDQLKLQREKSEAKEDDESSGTQTILVDDVL